MGVIHVATDKLLKAISYMLFKMVIPLKNYNRMKLSHFKLKNIVCIVM